MLHLFFFFLRLVLWSIVVNNACTLQYRSVCIQTKPNLSSYLFHYAEACNELAEPILASLRPGNTPPFKEMLDWGRAVGNTVSNLNGLKFELLTSPSRDELVTALAIISVLITSLQE